MHMADALLSPAVGGAMYAAILNFVYRMRPELLESAAGGRRVADSVSIRKTVAVAAALALLVGGGLSLYASSNPDGLEWSMEQVAGTTELVRNGSVHDTAAAIQEQTAILPDYDFAAGEGTGTSISGIVGALMTCALAGGVGLVVSVTKREQTKGTTGK